MQAEDFIQYKNIVLEIREVKKDGYKCSLCFAFNKTRRCKHLPLCWTKEKTFYFAKLSPLEIRRAKKAGRKITDYKEYI